MSDPITTIITAAIEHAPGTGAVVVAYKAAKPFLDKILAPSADELGEMGRDWVKGKRAQNTARTLADAATLLGATEREAQAVPLKVIGPLLNAASLEDEPTLAAKWAALLANAADPAQRVAVQPGFAEVLRQLTPTDALLLDSLYFPPQGSGLLRGQRMLKQFGGPGLDYASVTLSVDNLIRLHLCVGRTEKGGLFHDPDRPGTIAATLFVQQFMQACSAPVV